MYRDYCILKVYLEKCKKILNIEKLVSKENSGKCTPNTFLKIYPSS